MSNPQQELYKVPPYGLVYRPPQNIPNNPILTDSWRWDGNTVVRVDLPFDPPKRNPKKDADKLISTLNKQMQQVEDQLVREMCAATSSYVAPKEKMTFKRFPPLENDIPPLGQRFGTSPVSNSYFYLRTKPLTLGEKTMIPKNAYVVVALMNDGDYKIFMPYRMEQVDREGEEQIHFSQSNQFDFALPHWHSGKIHYVSDRDEVETKLFTLASYNVTHALVVKVCDLVSLKATSLLK